MDLLYSLLKISSMIATGMFGALGLLTKYKNDQGKISQWGKVALGGILISSGISLGLYVLETSKAKAKAIADQAEAKVTKQKLETILVNAETTAEQQKRSLEETKELKLGLEKSLKKSEDIANGMEKSLAVQQSVLSGNKRILGGVTNTVQKQGELLSLNTGTLKEVSRGLYSIKDVRVTYMIRVTPDHPQLESYINRFNRELAALRPQLTRDRLSWHRGGLSYVNGTFEEFGFSTDSPLLPDRSKEMLAHTILGYSTVELQFYKSPINPLENPWITNNWRNKPDLGFGVLGELSPKDPSERQLIFYESKPKQFVLTASRLPAEPQYWQSTGKIIAIPDLLGAQMFVVLRSFFMSGVPAVDKYLGEIRNRFELDTISISLSGGREFSFKRESLHKDVGENGPVYSFQFPNTMEELRRLER